MMKKLNLVIVMLVTVVIVFTACSNQSKKVNSDVENSVSFLADENENHDSKIVTETESSTEISTTKMPDEQKSASQQKVKSNQTTTKKSATQNKTENSVTTQKPTTNKKVTTTKKATTQTTTKKVTTTQKNTTTKQRGLSKSDIEWVQSQANSYIKSKGCNVDSSVGSFSGRISSKPYTSKSELLGKVKESIDYEYQHCIDSGWDSVDMYCKIESRSDGSYFIYVMYG